MKKLFLVAGFFLFSLTAHAQQKNQVQYIIDFSGSMGQKIEGRTQIDIARDSLYKSLAGVPADMEVAIRAYAHRVDQKNKEESCKDTELLFPFQKVNLDAIKSKLNALSPLGYTPIAYSLEQAAKDFPKEIEANRSIILLSDGEETCGGDPVQVIKNLIAGGFKVKVDAIGFNVDAATRKLLEEIAAVGGGKYYDAKDADQLAESLKEATEKAFVKATEVEAVDAVEITGGKNLDNPKPFDEFVGKGFRLAYDEKSEDYFSINLKSGELVTLEIQSADKRVDYPSIRLLNSQQNMVIEVRKIGDMQPYQKLTASYHVPNELAGKYTLTVAAPGRGSNYRMKVSKELLDDLGSGRDAGNTVKTALPIEVNKLYETNWTSSSDNTDIFKFRAKADDKYSLKYIPEECSNKLYSTILVIDDVNSQIYKSKRVGEGQGIKSEFSTAEDGEYYIKLTTERYGGVDLCKYSIELISK